jgi:hypothetical protein
MEKNKLTGMMLVLIGGILMFASGWYEGAKRQRLKCHDRIHEYEMVQDETRKLLLEVMRRYKNENYR